jgi:hypothetical protein
VSITIYLKILGLYVHVWNTSRFDFLHLGKSCFANKTNIWKQNKGCCLTSISTVFCVIYKVISPYKIYLRIGKLSWKVFITKRTLSVLHFSKRLKDQLRLKDLPLTPFIISKRIPLGLIPYSYFVTCTSLKVILCFVWKYHSFTFAIFITY